MSPIRRVRSCVTIQTALTAFEPSSKRKQGFPSETKVKRGDRVVHEDKELFEKLGRNDLCPCSSGRRFQALLYEHRQVLTGPTGTTTAAE